MLLAASWAVICSYDRPGCKGGRDRTNFAGMRPGLLSANMTGVGKGGSLLWLLAGCLLLAVGYTPKQYSGPATGGPGATGRYPVHTGAAYVTRYPEPPGDFDVPPTLEQLNKVRLYDFDPAASVHLDGFSLWVLDDFGRHDPANQEYVRLSGKDLENGDYHLVVHLRDAPSITDLFFYVRYHIDRYNPRLVKPGSAFGLEGDRLWLSKDDVPGVIAAGMTRVRPDINGGTTVTDGVICEIAFEKHEADDATWYIERAPNHSHNQPVNVTAYSDPEDEAVVIYWQEANLGDNNNDGEVTITDLIPLGRRYGRLSTDGHEDDWDFLLDSQRDGEVNYRDVWPIIHNYGSLLQGYRVYRRPAGSPRRDEVLLKHRTYPLLPMSIHRPTVWDPIRINEYRYADRELPRTARPREWTYRIVPYNACDDQEGDGSDIEITISVTTDGIVTRSIE